MNALDRNTMLDLRLSPCGTDLWDPPIESVSGDDEFLQGCEAARQDITQNSLNWEIINNPRQTNFDDGYLWKLKDQGVEILKPGEKATTPMEETKIVA